MNDNVVDINSRVDVDLDLEETKLEKKPDFFFTRDGRMPAEGVSDPDPERDEDWAPVAKRRLRVTDPNLVDWRILAGLDDEVEILGEIIPEEDDKVFLRNNPIPVAVLEILVKKIIAHFGRPDALGKKRLPI